MLDPHSFFDAVSFKDRIYAVGEDISQVYDTENNQWKYMPSPDKCGSGRNLIVFEDDLVAIGGLTGKTEEWKVIPTVQYYDFGN